MNSITKISTAVALGLSLMGTCLAADAASARPAVKAEQIQGSDVSHAHGKVIQLGTIVVTRADAEGAHATYPKPNYRSTIAFRGPGQVTDADSTDVRAAAVTARADGGVFLGSIQVTPADSIDARYAVGVAERSGSVYLGTVMVKAHNGKLPVIGSLLALADSTGPRPLLTMVGALVFGRTGG